MPPPLSSYPPPPESYAQPRPGPLRVCSRSREWSRHVLFRVGYHTTWRDHMPWNRTTQKDLTRYSRSDECDATDQEWATIEVMLPKQGRLGCPRQTNLREVFNAIQYVLAVGCQWGAPGAAENFSGLLRGLVIDNSYRWRGIGVFDRMMDALHDLARAQRGTEPSAGIIGSQSVKITEAPARAAKMTARRSWAVSGWRRRPGDRNCGSSGDRAGPRLLTGSDCDAAGGRGKRQETFFR